MSKHHSFTVGATLLMALATQLVSPQPAIAGKFLDQTGCSQCCPECKHACKLDVEEIEVEKKCFEVESEVICIPRVVFPWQRKSVRRACDSCDGRGCNTCCHKGAKTRKVKILSSRKYKCPKCEYTWSAEKKPCGPCGGGGCSTGCSTGCDHQANGIDHETHQLPVPGDVQMQQPVEVPSYGDEDSTGLETIEVHHP